jgi:hypothetical protein
MKRFLFSTVLCVASLVTHLEGYCPRTYYYSEETTYYYPERSYVPEVHRHGPSWGEILGEVAIGVGASCLAYCAYKQEPFNALNDARSKYNTINKKLLRFLDEYAVDSEDVADLAASFYVKSMYPLVTVSQHLDAARNSTKEALKDVRRALSMCNEVAFARDCNHVKGLLLDRLELINDALTGIHTHPLWAAQYALFMEERYYQDVSHCRSYVTTYEFRPRRVVVVESW